MARQVTLSDVEIRHISINQIIEGADGETGKAGSPTGYSCTLQYVIKDADGNRVAVEESQKYTSGTSYSDSQKLSGGSDKLVMDFVSTMIANMNAKEEL